MTEIQKLIRQYLGFQFFFSLLLWVPVFYEFQKSFGLNDAQIFRIQSVYYLVFCLFEIPTGFFADRFGYRQSVRAGAFLLIIANLLPIGYQTYTAFLVHFILIALSRSLISGAASAYLYEFLHKEGASELYRKIEGDARALSLIGKVVCWSATGFLMKWLITLPYWLTVVNAVIAFAISLTFVDLQQKFGKSKIRQQGLLQLPRVLISSKMLVLIMAQGIGIFVLARVAQINLFQPVLRTKSFDLSSFGWIMGLMTVCEAIGAFNTTWVRGKLSDLKVIYLFTWVIAASLFFIPYHGQALTVAAFCLFSLSLGFTFPIQRQLLNDAITDPNYRASLLSVESILDRAASALLISFAGVYVGGGRVGDFLQISTAIALGFVTLVFVVIQSQSKKI